MLKFLAKRSKDVLDLLWLLREPGLLDRTRIRQLLASVLGQTGAQLALAGLETYYVQTARSWPPVMKTASRHNSVREAV